MKQKLTQEYLKEALTYDPETGIFTWNTRPLSHFKNSKGQNTENAKSANCVCGYSDKDGYIIIGINGDYYKSHRLAFLYMEGYLPENLVDHIDKNTSNNKWDNLREVSVMCNGQNCHLAKNNTSGVTGVSWDKDMLRYRSSIMTAGVAKRLGSFTNLDDAVMARYQEEITNPLWTCSTESPAYKYLKERNLI